MTEKEIEEAIELGVKALKEEGEEKFTNRLALHLKDNPLTHIEITLQLLGCRSFKER